MLLGKIYMNKSRYVITEEYTIMQALERLDEVETKVLFVERDNQLCATITDGDIRRAILRKISLMASVRDIAHYQPYYVKQGEEKLGLQLLIEKKIPAAPIVNEQFEIVGICRKEDEDNKEEKSEDVIDVPVVIMAGGLGTRLYPYTKILPKALIPINDIPISEYIIHFFQKAGFQKFYMIVNHKKNMIKAYFNDMDKDIKIDIKFAEEMLPLGTGGGIQLLKDQIDSTFILTNCDILILDDLRKMLCHHKEQNNQVTMVCSLRNFEIPYGVVNFTKGGEINSFEEKPKMSFFTNTGYYILEPDIFRYVEENESIGMPDIIMRMKADGQKIGTYPISENAWLDMGQIDTMESMERKLREMNIII